MPRLTRKAPDVNVRTIRMATVRRTVIALAASASAVPLAACGVIDGTGGSSSSANPSKGDDITVGLLLPDRWTPKYDKSDYPVFKKQVLLLTHNKGKVRYANADGDAAEQNRQLDRMIAEKVDVLVVDATDPEAIAPGIRKAKAAGIPVIAYERLAKGPIDAYVAFDTQFVGMIEGRALLDELGSRAATSKIVMMNGSLTTPDAVALKEGALSQLRGKVDIAKSYNTAGWTPENAKKNMENAIQGIGAGNIDGVVVANDHMAGAVIDTLKEAGVSKIPPVVGQDADLSAVQRIIAGEQLMTVYRTDSQEATDAAEMAVDKVQGRSIEFDALTRDKVNSPTEKNIPARLEPVVALTKDNVEDTVIPDGVYTVKQICTPEYKAECAAIGLK